MNMTDFLSTLRKPSFLLAVLLAAAFFNSWAGPGHDHGEAPAAAAGPAKPRFTATSEDYELVGVVNGKRITLYLDHAADNRPVKEATLELDLGGTKLAVQPHGEGEFEAMLAKELQPGVTSVTATVVAGQQSDLLAGELDIHADTPNAGAAHGARWKTLGSWGAAGLLLLGALAGLLVVRKKQGGAAW